MRNEEFWCPAEPDGFKSFRPRRERHLEDGPTHRSAPTKLSTLHSLHLFPGRQIAAPTACFGKIPNS